MDPPQGKMAQYMIQEESPLDVSNELIEKVHLDDLGVYLVTFGTLV